MEYDKFYIEQFLKMSFLVQIIIMNMIKKINIFKKEVKQMEFK